MKITVAVYASANMPASYTALQYCRAVVQSEHSLYRIFFYGNGVHTASDFFALPQDELDLPAAWKDFIAENNLDAVVCIAAALRRGILNSDEAARYEKSGHNLAKSYDLSGLGQLIEAAATSDRVITFGE